LTETTERPTGMKAQAEQLKARRKAMEDEMRDAIRRFQTETGWFVSSIDYGQSFVTCYPMDSENGERASGGIRINAEVVL
jgi:hypothetical protein